MYNIGGVEMKIKVMDNETIEEVNDWLNKCKKKIIEEINQSKKFSFTITDDMFDLQIVRKYK